MATLSILQFPDKRLQQVAQPVVNIDNKIIQITNDMLETMYAAKGVGLAATQVDIQQRIIVVDVSEQGNNPLVIINPEIISNEGSITWEEGCLSFPGVYAKVTRAEKIVVEYLDLKNKKHQLSADKLLGVCLQHEIDHLNGITFYDHLSRVKKHILQTKLEKLRKQTL